MSSIALKTLRDLRWQVIGYGIGLALMAAMVAFLYPSYSEQFADFEIPPALQGFLGDVQFTTPAGFIGAEFFSWTPALLVVFAIMAGTSALAGEEVKGTLDLLMAQSIARSRLVMDKIAGLLVASVIVTLIIGVGWALSVPFVAELDLSYTRLAIATALIIPFVMLFGLFAMWAGAAFPTRGGATGFVTIVAVASYFVNYLSSIVDAIAPLRYLSVFHYYDGASILTDGVNVVDLTVLLVLTLLFGAMTVGSFARRDLGVHEGGLVLPKLS